MPRYFQYKNTSRPGMDMSSFSNRDIPAAQFGGHSLAGVS